MSRSPTFLARLEPPFCRFVNVVHVNPETQTTVQQTSSTVHPGPEHTQEFYSSTQGVVFPEDRSSHDQDEVLEFRFKNVDVETRGSETSNETDIATSASSSTTREIPQSPDIWEQGHNDTLYASSEEDALILKDWCDCGLCDANRISSCLHNRRESCNKSQEFNSAEVGSLSSDTGSESGNRYSSGTEDGFYRVRPDAGSFPAQRCVRSKVFIRLASPVGSQEVISANQQNMSRQMSDNCEDSHFDGPEKCRDSKVSNEDESSTDSQEGFVCFALVGQQEELGSDSDLVASQTGRPERKEIIREKLSGRQVFKEQAYSSINNSEEGLFACVVTGTSGGPAVRVRHGNNSRPPIALPTNYHGPSQEMPGRESVRETLDRESSSVTGSPCGFESGDSKGAEEVQNKSGAVDYYADFYIEGNLNLNLTLAEESEDTAGKHQFVYGAGWDTEGEDLNSDFPAFSEQRFLKRPSFEGVENLEMSSFPSNGLFGEKLENDKCEAQLQPVEDCESSVVYRTEKFKTAGGDYPCEETKLGLFFAWNVVQERRCEDDQEKNDLPPPTETASCWSAEFPALQQEPCENRSLETKQENLRDASCSIDELVTVQQEPCEIISLETKQENLRKETPLIDNTRIGSHPDVDMLFVGTPVKSRYDDFAKSSSLHDCFNGSDRVEPSQSRRCTLGSEIESSLEVAKEDELSFEATQRDHFAQFESNVQHGGNPTSCVVQGDWIEDKFANNCNNNQVCPEMEESTSAFVHVNDENLENGNENYDGGYNDEYASLACENTSTRVGDFTDTEDSSSDHVQSISDEGGADNDSVLNNKNIWILKEDVNFDIFHKSTSDDTSSAEDDNYDNDNDDDDDDDHGDDAEEDDDKNDIDNVDGSNFDGFHKCLSDGSDSAEDGDYDDDDDVEDDDDDDVDGDDENDIDNMDGKVTNHDPLVSEVELCKEPMVCFGAGNQESSAEPSMDTKIVHKNSLTFHELEEEIVFDFCCAQNKSGVSGDDTDRSDDGNFDLSSEVSGNVCDMYIPNFQDALQLPESSLPEEDQENSTKQYILNKQDKNNLKYPEGKVLPKKEAELCDLDSAMKSQDILEVSEASPNPAVVEHTDVERTHRRIHPVVEEGPLASMRSASPERQLGVDLGSEEDPHTCSILPEESFENAHQYPLRWSTSCDSNPDNMDDSLSNLQTGNEPADSIHCSLDGSGTEAISPMDSQMVENEVDSKFAVHVSTVEVQEYGNYPGVDNANIIEKTADGNLSQCDSISTNENGDQFVSEKESLTSSMETAYIVRQEEVAQQNFATIAQEEKEEEKEEEQEVEVAHYSCASTPGDNDVESQQRFDCALVANYFTSKDLEVGSHLELSSDVFSASPFDMENADVNILDLNTKTIQPISSISLEKTVSETETNDVTAIGNIINPTAHGEVEVSTLFEVKVDGGPAVDGTNDNRAPDTSSCTDTDNTDVKQFKVTASYENVADNTLSVMQSSTIDGTSDNRAPDTPSCTDTDNTDVKQFKVTASYENMADNSLPVIQSSTSGAIFHKLGLEEGKIQQGTDEAQGADSTEKRDAAPLHCPSNTSAATVCSKDFGFSYQQLTNSPCIEQEIYEEGNVYLYETEVVCCIDLDEKDPQFEGGVCDVTEKIVSNVFDQTVEIPDQTSTPLDSSLDIFDDRSDTFECFGVEDREPESSGVGDCSLVASSNLPLINETEVVENVVDEVVCSYEEFSNPHDCLQNDRSPDSQGNSDETILVGPASDSSSEPGWEFNSKFESFVEDHPLTEHNLTHDLTRISVEKYKFAGHRFVDKKTQTDGATSNLQPVCDCQTQTEPLSSFTVSRESQVELVDGRSAEESSVEMMMDFTANSRQYVTAPLLDYGQGFLPETNDEASVVIKGGELEQPISWSSKPEDRQTGETPILQGDRLWKAQGVDSVVNFTQVSNQGCQTETVAKEVCNHECQTDLVEEHVSIPNRESKGNQTVAMLYFCCDKECQTKTTSEAGYMQNESEFEVRTVQSRTELRTNALVDQGCQVELLQGLSNSNENLEHLSDHLHCSLEEVTHVTGDALQLENQNHTVPVDCVVEKRVESPQLENSEHRESAATAQSFASPKECQTTQWHSDAVERSYLGSFAKEKVETDTAVSCDSKHCQTSLDIEQLSQCSKQCQTLPWPKFANLKIQGSQENEKTLENVPQGCSPQITDFGTAQRPTPYGQSAGPRDKPSIEFLSSSEANTEESLQSQSVTEPVNDAAKRLWTVQVDKSCQVLLCNCGNSCDGHEREISLVEMSRASQSGAAIRVSEGMQKEQESLIKQLDMLRDMNQRLRDDKDAIEAAHEAKKERGHSLSDEIEEAEKKTKVSRQGSHLSKYVKKKRSPNPGDTWGHQGSVESISSEEAEAPGDISPPPLHDSIEEEAEFDGDHTLELLSYDKVQELERPAWAKKIMALAQPEGEKKMEAENGASEEELEEDVFRKRKAELISGAAHDRSEEDESDVSLSEELSDGSGSDSGDRPTSPRAAPVGKDNEMSRTESQDFSEAGVSAISEVTTPERVFKVVFVGDSGVGKSSFIHRFCHDTWRASFTATIGVDFQIKTMNLEGRCIALQLWDTAGQERFRSITKQYFRKADGVIVFYDVTMETSFLNIKNWMISVEEGTDDGTAIMIVGNKTDLVEDDSQRAVRSQDGKRLAEECKAIYAETSAKTGHNIHEAMVQFSKMLQVREDELMQSILNLVDVSEQPKKKNKCCK